MRSRTWQPPTGIHQLCLHGRNRATDHRRRSDEEPSTLRLPPVEACDHEPDPSILSDSEGTVKRSTGRPRPCVCLRLRRLCSQHNSHTTKESAFIAVPCEHTPRAAGTPYARTTRSLSFTVNTLIPEITAN